MNSQITHPDNNMNEKSDLTTTNALQLRRNGNFQEAIEIYSKLFELKGKTPFLLDRGKTYLLIGNYPAALSDFKKAIEIEDPKLLADVYFIALGIAYWYLNQPERTIDVWIQGLKAPYTDAAGGVELPALILYSAARLKHQTLREKALKLLGDFSDIERRAWPGDIAPFLLGKIDEVELQIDIEARKSDILRNRYRCQADFFIGLRAYLENDINKFKKMIRKCANYAYGDHQYEYYLGLWEIERGYPEPPFK